MLTFSLPFFTLIKGLFIFSSLSAIRGLSSVYLRLLIFLLELLTTACDASTGAFHMMYTAQNLNKQGVSIQPCHTLPNLEPVSCSVSGSSYCFLTHIKASQEIGMVVWYSQLFKNFSQLVVIYTVKGCSIVNEAEVDVFHGISLFFLLSNEYWQLDF